MREDRELLQLNDYNIPHTCKNCGGVMIFKGVGEYQCEDCKAIDYDDYGKVRKYVEEHKGATAAEVAAATKVTQRSIRNMLKEGRLQVAPNSRAFLNCEMCGKSISSGRLCAECETKYHRKLEEKVRQMHKKDMHGVAMGHGDATGEKRFKLDR